MEGMSLVIFNACHLGNPERLTQVTIILWREGVEYKCPEEKELALFDSDKNSVGKRLRVMTELGNLRRLFFSRQHERKIC